MQRRKILMAAATIITTLTLSGTPVWAAPTNIEIFGTTLKGAKRDQLREVFKQGGMAATREDSSYWVDIYNSSNVLDGTTQFEVGYAMQTNEFAYAKYTFPGAMNTGLVKDVIDMVTSKYGQPSQQSGQYRLGTVTATWNVGQNMKIEVFRGWPNTTTFLSFIDVASKKAMQAEMDANDKQIREQKAAAQSNAF